VADLKSWKERPAPARQAMEGRYVRLEPLQAGRHGDGLFACSSILDVADAQERFRWLGDYAPETRAAFEPWLEKAEASEDPLFFAVIDKRTGRIGGRQTLMRTDRGNGVTEIGNIYWGPEISRTPAATEALYLFARHAFDDLGYRRFEWKCDNANEPSKKAARRFGFQHEGLFRQHMIIKGKNRDTAWFSILDSEWPLVRKALEAWLDPSNFDTKGRQKERLEDLRERLSA
jgi:RimJ/RimL family protein N-acetyltransferase